MAKPAKRKAPAKRVRDGAVNQNGRGAARYSLPDEQVSPRRANERRARVTFSLSLSYETVVDVNDDAALEAEWNSLSSIIAAGFDRSDDALVDIRSTSSRLQAIDSDEPDDVQAVDDDDDGEDEL